MLVAYCNTIHQGQPIRQEHKGKMTHEKAGEWDQTISPKSYRCLSTLTNGPLTEEIFDPFRIHKVH